MEEPRTNDLATLCLRLPELWQCACAEVAHECQPRAILEGFKCDVRVPLNGGHRLLPNIQGRLLALA